MFMVLPKKLIKFKTNYSKFKFEEFKIILLTKLIYFKKSSNQQQDNLNLVFAYYIAILKFIKFKLKISFFMSYYNI